MYQTNFNRWFQHPNLDPSYKKELESMDEATKQDAFYTNIAFGTAGMRGLLGAGTNRINIHTIRKANAGFAQYIIEQGTDAMKRGIAIAYDNRHMSYEFAMDSAKYFASKQIHSYVFPQLRPTPELSFALRHFHCFGGIMITASHNPKEYNGYKLYDETGCQLIPELAEKVIQHVNAITDELAISYDETAIDSSYIHILNEEVDEAYYQAVSNIQLRKDVERSNLKIVFSPQHGTANIPVQEVFKRNGYSYILVEEQAMPNPEFANTKSCNPEEELAYELPIAYAKKHQADLILICDPDADRMGVGIYDKGDYCLLSGNQSGAILIEYICSYYKETNCMPQQPVIFNTIVTSDLGEKIANAYGVDVEKTLTGFKFIGSKIAQYEKTNEKQYLFGYEESYGSLIQPFVRDKDAVQACLLLAEAAAYYKQKNMTLKDVLENLYQTYGYYYESQTSITLTGQEGLQKMNTMLETLRKHPLTHIANTNVIQIEDYWTQTILQNGNKETLSGFHKANVLKYYLENGSWIAIRPSGTEPKCKIYYCIKGSSNSDVKALNTNYQNYMMEYLKNI